MLFYIKADSSLFDFVNKLLNFKENIYKSYEVWYNEIEQSSQKDRLVLSEICAYIIYKFIYYTIKRGCTVFR